MSQSHHLLEINVVSAQDLEPVSKVMNTYAVTWLNPERKLLTRVDQDGYTNPTWNEKFLFRVDNEFLNSDTSAIMVEIHASSWIRDILIGTVRVLVNNLLLPQATSRKGKSRMRIVPLQVRRPSGRPQGILNVGVTLLDSNISSMPIYRQFSASAIGYWDIMAVNKAGRKKSEEEFPSSNDVDVNKATNIKSEVSSNYTDNRSELQSNAMSYLQRSQSERSEFMGDKFVVEMTSVDELDFDAFMRGKFNIPKKPLSSVESSKLDDWATEITTSAEGLKSKIARWQYTLPPIQDSTCQKYETPAVQTVRRSSRHRRRHSTGGGGSGSGSGGGLFSCFGKACGLRFSIICGGGSRKKRTDQETRINLLTDTDHDDSYL
ncbi:hypothetical protein SO802_012999 [Lithocarpus litseifolius]|uniref:C2 domain-containing protein n=1 Tax=Lithocarpus litseifolius TaxID=425828 RepID=A0AAW2D6Z9_9ROSI